MFRSLRGRLIVLLVLLAAAAIAAGALMIGLFRQSATAQSGQPKRRSVELATRSPRPTAFTLRDGGPQPPELPMRLSGAT
jgi:hypothetical protein